MSRDDGFAVMDVSVDIVNDPKVRKLFRHAPDHAAVAFMAYVATLAESWRSGQRVNVDDAWPSVVAFDKRAVEALVSVGLLDRHGFVPLRAWRSWFIPAHSRRETLREKWRRTNEKRRADTAELPRGSDEVTATPVPYRTVPSVPTDNQEGERDSLGTERGRHVSLVDPKRGTA